MRVLTFFALVAAMAVACGPPATPDTLVYITEGGTKYHRKECRLKKGSHAVRLGDLPAKYSPCKQCEPPVMPKQ